MSNKPLPIIFLTLGFAFVLLYPYDTPEPVAKKQTAQQRFDKAAQAICGGNAGYELAGITLTCSTKRGHITQKVAIK